MLRLQCTFKLTGTKQQFYIFAMFVNTGFDDCTAASSGTPVRYDMTLGRLVRASRRFERTYCLPFWLD